MASGALGILVLIAFTQAIHGASREGDAAGARSELSVRAQVALFELRSGVRNTAFTSDGAYPLLATPSELASLGWTAEAPNPSDVSAATNRGLVFRLPADADADGRPDLSPSGEPEWDPREFAYVLAGEPSGRNRIELWIDGAFDTVIARHVETFTVDSYVTAPADVPLGCLRFSVVLGRDHEGHVVSRQGELAVHISQSGVEL